MGAGPGGNEYQVCHGDRRANDVHKGRRGVDHHEADTLPLQGGHVLGQTGDVDCGKERRLSRALIPPVGQTALRVGIHHGDRSSALTLRFDG